MRQLFRQVRGEQAAFLAQVKGALADGSLLADPFDEEPPGREDVEAQLSSAMERFDELGIEVKDPERGLIDFFSLRDGKTIYLCYELGEDDIRFWHTLEGGYAGRQPLD
jgi:hypothetical protein